MNELSRTQGIQTQMTPLWDRLRENPSKNHRTSVDRAIDAHRDQVHERRERIQKEFGTTPNLMNKFFPMNPTANTAVTPNSSTNKTDVSENEETSLADMSDSNPLTQPESGVGYKDDLVDDFRRSTTKAPPSPVEVPKGSYIDLEV